MFAAVSLSGWVISEFFKMQLPQTKMSLSTWLPVTEVLKERGDLDNRDNLIREGWLSRGWQLQQHEDPGDKKRWETLFHASVLNNFSKASGTLNYSIYFNSFLNHDGKSLGFGVMQPEVYALPLTPAVKQVAVVLWASISSMIKYKYKIITSRDKVEVKNW